MDIEARAEKTAEGQKKLHAGNLRPRPRREFRNAPGHAWLGRVVGLPVIHAVVKAGYGLLIRFMLESSEGAL
jgi:hypothetical protein